jgi:hypothetical protein
MALISRSFSQSTVRATSFAPSAKPRRPMINPTANAVSAPTQIALHATGQRIHSDP